jgi:hypothetical protein
VQQLQLRLVIESLARHYNTPVVLPHHRELLYTVLSCSLPCAFDDCSDNDDELEDERDDNEEHKSSSDQNKEGGEAPKEVEELGLGFQKQLYSSEYTFSDNEQNSIFASFYKCSFRISQSFM